MEDYYGTVFISHIPCSSTPLRVSALPVLTAISAADATCGLSTDGEAFCWGRSQDAGVSSTVRLVNIAATSEIFAGVTASPVYVSASMCGATASGAVYCGGVNHLNAVLPTVPLAVIVAGWGHQCGVTRDSGLAYCWGENVAGHLGNGTRINTTTPTPVQAPLQTP